MIERRANVWILILGLLLLAFAAGRLSTRFDAPATGVDGVNQVSQDQTEWTCSMHPQIRLAEAGDCPICGMELVPVESGEVGGHAEEAERDGGAAAGYACAMNCVPPLPEPGDCPICGMEMVPVGGPGPGVTQSGEESPFFELDRRARDLARLETSPVRRRYLEAEIPLYGRFTVDDNRLADITSWTAGRITRLHVKTEGLRVRRGAPLYDIYSPQLIAAQEELLLGYGGESAREKLRLLGLDAESISGIEEEGSPREVLTIRAPAAGTVLELPVREGDYVREGSLLFRIADLSRLWLWLEVYEADLSLVHEGLTLEYEVEAHPGRSFKATIDYLDPALDPGTRSLGVRAAVDNSAGLLKPEMFAGGTLRSVLRREGGFPLSVPASAPLFTGRRALVYVEAEVGRYEAREVRLGRRAGDYYEVLEGLAEGEAVVIRGAFKIDSSLQIQGRTSMMQPEPDESSVTHGIGAGHHGH